MNRKMAYVDGRTHTNGTNGLLSQCSMETNSSAVATIEDEAQRTHKIIDELMNALDELEQKLTPVFTPEMTVGLTGDAMPGAPISPLMQSVRSMNDRINMEIARIHTIIGRIEL